jgi:hypothetical protein
MVSGRGFHGGVTMTKSSNHSRRLSALAVAVPLAAMLSIAVGQAAADDSQAPAGGGGAGAVQPAAPAPGALPAQPPAANAPGFLHQLGVWWNDGFGDFHAKMKAAKDKIDDYNKKQSEAAKEASTATEQALKDAAQATKDAATAVVKLPGTRVFEMHERCQKAGNGAPDCETTANNVCRTKGFATGKPLDVSTAQECPARVVLSGRQPLEGECPDVTTLLRAICQ